MIRNTMVAVSLLTLLLSASGWAQPLERSPEVAQSQNLTSTSPVSLPYKEAGLSERQAAAVLLRRFTFGPRPGEVEQVVEMGLHNWLDQQLSGQSQDADLEARLSNYPAVGMSTVQQRQRYYFYGKIQEFARNVGLFPPKDGTEMETQDYNTALNAYRAKQGYYTVDELYDEARSSKMLRAIYSKNQLREVLVDFWFNHFNVNAIDGNVRFQVMDYENRALRPFALGKFESLVQATAKHPAMLYYLNNAQSYATPGVATTLESCMESIEADVRDQWRQGQPGKRKSGGGLNENYARELLELHTLGVDGGYTQKDVTELARVLTGWGVVYPDTVGDYLRHQLEGKERLGYRWMGDFAFRADLHDATPKRVLDFECPANGGIEEGEQAITYLSHHPSAARFVCRKLARRFVNDEPSSALVETLSQSFRQSDGDISEVLRCLVRQPEFWKESSQLAKVRTPFEYAVAIFRSTGAEVQPSRALFSWLTRLGAPLYECAPPTGYPDLGPAWLSPGLMVNRMNFAQNVIFGRIQGVEVPVDRNCPPELDDQGAEVFLAQRYLPEVASAKDELAKAIPTIHDPGDGYVDPRKWFDNPSPTRFESKKSLAWRKRLVATALTTPFFQRR